MSRACDDPLCSTCGYKPETPRRPISVIDFCCGRTQHDRCAKCGRDFLETRPTGVQPHELPEYRAYQAGLRHGAAIGAGVVMVVCAIASFVWAALR